MRLLVALPLPIVLSALVAVPTPSQGQATDDAPLAAVAARRLARGAVLEAGDIVLARVPARSGDAREVQAVAPGWITRRLVRAGEPLRPPAVTPPPLVAAGTPVRYVVRRDGLALHVDGIAVIAASLGDTIPVRLGAKRRVRGIVTGPASVSALDSLRNP